MWLANIRSSCLQPFASANFNFCNNVCDNVCSNFCINVCNNACNNILTISVTMSVTMLFCVSNKMQQLAVYFISLQDYCPCFGLSLHPSSGVHKL
jgi:hypothetical protein